MSLQLCNEHNHLKQFICARNQCTQLLCKQCFKPHSQVCGHGVGVRLSLQSKQFFLKWTEFILKKIISFQQIVTQMGYSKIFEMRLQPNHPKGTVSQLSFQDIQKVAIQALEEHKKITEGNLIFIRGTESINEMINVQFLKDLFNIACEDAKFNLTTLLTDFRKRLVDCYPEKEIYRFAKFNIISKEIGQVQEERTRLVQQYEERIMLRVGQKKEQSVKVGQLSPNKPRTEQGLINQPQSQTKQQLPHNNPSSSLYQNPSTRDPTQQLQTNQQPSSPTDITNISTVSNPSQTAQQLREVDISTRNISDTISDIEKKQSYQQLATTIAFLKSNQAMYQQKIAQLLQQNVLLKTQVERLAKVEQRVVELQRVREEEKPRDQSIHTQSQEKVAILLQNQLQAPLLKQLHQMQKVQANLIQQNSKLNIAMKDLEDIAQGRFRTIHQLQQQIKTLSDNIQLKQRSIQQLNQLISNQEEQISYRENEVQILGQEIKKLMDKITFLEKSIHELNNLVSNQEQQISYRENQVQTLGEEINKLLNRIKQLENSVKSLNSLIANEQEEISYRENQSEILQGEVKKLLDKIQYLEKSIHQLNNLIANEEEEIAYRENESETLTKQVTTLIQKNKLLQAQIIEVNEKKNELQQKIISTQQNQAGLLNEATQNLLLLKNQLQLLNQQNQTLKTEITLFKEKYNFVENQLTNATKANTSQQIQLKTLTQTNTMLETELNVIKAELVNFKAEFNLTNQQLNDLQKSTTLVPKLQQTIDQQLLEQVVQMEAQLKNKTHDISLLLNVTQDYLDKATQTGLILSKLRELKTVSFRPKY